jgi:hypothetical protein
MTRMTKMLVAVLGSLIVVVTVMPRFPLSPRPHARSATTWNYCTRMSLPSGPCRTDVVEALA